MNGKQGTECDSQELEGVRRMSSAVFLLDFSFNH
jgi:hypothetical protein